MQSKTILLCKKGIIIQWSSLTQHYLAIVDLIKNNTKNWDPQIMVQSKSVQLDCSYELLFLIQRIGSRLALFPSWCFGVQQWWWHNHRAPQSITSISIITWHVPIPLVAGVCEKLYLKWQSEKDCSKSKHMIAIK